MYKTGQSRMTTRPPRRSFISRIHLATTLVVAFAVNGPSVASSTTFNDFSASAGINVTCSCAFFNCGYGVAFLDYDADGDLDVYVAMDGGVANKLYSNDGTGHFVDVAAAAGVADLGVGKGVKWKSSERQSIQLRKA